MSLPEIQSLLSSQLPDKNYKLQVAVNSLIAKKTTASQFQEIANQFQKDSFSSFFIDAIWLQDQLGIDQFYLVNIVKSLLPRLNINHLRVRLEPELLDKLKLLDVDLTSFRKRQVRLNTSLLYRQQKFNLLREESEGYSKLIVTLISFSPSTLDNVMSLIGYFNLDSNRVLDIILDVLIVNFIDHWRFILDLLIKSPWFSNNSSKTTCSQLLGFKFSHYNNPEITIVAPPQLYWVAALLIKRNMVLLEDLYPYLYPLDENIDKLYAEFNDKCKSECNVCKFSMDFSDSSKPPDATPVIKLKENQKAHLVSALIGLGVIQKAQRILNRLPQLVEIHSDIAENVCKCLHVILDPIYSTIRPSIETLPVPSRDTFPEAQPINKHVLFQNQVFNARDGLFYSKVKFFCDEWSDGLPSANTLDSAFLNIKLLLSYVGTYLFKDLFLFNKIIRIGRAHVLAVKNGWLILLSNYLLPSFSGVNDMVGNEIYSLISLFPYETRYALYGEWKAKMTSIPVLEVIATGRLLDAKWILKRLSKENALENGRKLAKLIHANPTIILPAIIEMLQNYPNQIDMIITASKYFTELDYDVFSFSVIDALSSKLNKPRIDETGTAYTKWFLALSNLCGSLWTRYDVSHEGLLSYIIKQLINDSIHDLLILENLISQMTGQTITGEFTVAQRDALSGGPALRRELSMDETVISKQSTTRFIEELNDGFAFPLGILIAQHRRQIVHLERVDELKILGWEFDKIHSNFLMYFDFIADNMKQDIYSETFKTVGQLINYGIEPEVAFYIQRPRLNWLIKRSENDSVKIETILHSDWASAINRVDNEAASDVWQVALESTIREVPSFLPKSALDNISCHFYVTFWQLSLYDIDVPAARYETEIKRLQLRLSAGIDKDNTVSVEKKASEKERVQLLILQFEAELKAQDLWNTKVMNRLMLEKDNWFTNSLDCHATSVQYCFLPRCLFSPSDAIFCAKFLFTMHKLGTHNFFTWLLIENILNPATLAAIIFSCTEFEAKNFGQFLAELFSTLTRWFKSADVYNAECQNVPGFCTTFKSTRIPMDQETISKENLSYAEFGRLFYKWHTTFRNAVIACFNSKEYMQVRNSILVLDRLRDFFPLHQSNGEKIEAFIRDICDTETKRDDLKLLALGYLQKLNLSKPTWIENKRKSTNISTEVAEKSESNKLVSDSMPEIYQKNRDDIVDTKYSRGERRDGREKRKMNPSPDRNIQYDNYSRTRQQYSTKDSRTEVVERREERSSRNRDLVRTNSNAGKKAQDVANSIVVPSKNVEEDNLLSPKKMSIRSAVDVARKVAEKVVRADSSAGANSEKDAKSKADTAKLLEKLKTLEPGEVTLLPPEKKREEKREEPSRNRSRSRERKDVREKRDDRKEADSKLTRKRTEEFIESDREAKRKKNDNERSDRRNDDRSDRKDEERRSPRRDDRRKDDRDSRGRDSRDRRY